jgi:hypothetical protein
MNPFLIAAMNFLQSSTKRNKNLSKKELSGKDKTEIEKINGMGLFSAIEYLKTKK